MRGLRIGSWCMVVGLAGYLLGTLSWIVVGRVQVLGLIADHTWIEAYATTAGWIDLGFAAMVAIGATRCALASEGTPRRWFAAVVALTAGAHLLIYLPWLLSTVSSSPPWEGMLWLYRAPFVATAAAALCYAAAAARLETHRALVRTLVIAVGIEIATFVLGLVTRDGPLASSPEVVRILGAVAGMVAQIAWLYLVLDVLAAFPASHDVPLATVTARPRKVAGGVAIALCVIGTGFAAFALWGTRRVSSADAMRDALVVGVVMFVIGAFVLSRLRGRRVPIVGAVIAAGVLVAVASLVTHANVTPVEDVELVPQRAPGLAIALPAGKVERDLFTRELGSITVMTRHSDLGLVTLSWRRSRSDPSVERARATTSQITSETFTEQAGALAIHGVMWSLENIAQLYATWQCPGDPRWFSLEISRYAPGTGVLRRVGARIFASIACGGDAADAPPFALVFDPPAGYRPVVAKGAQVFRFEGEGSSAYSFVWSADADYVDALHDDPGAVLAMIQWKDHADRVEWLPLMPMAHRGDIVETDPRQLAEVVVGDVRVLMTAWRCFGLDIDVIGFFVGPASLPRDPAIAGLRAARCPK